MTADSSGSGSGLEGLDVSDEPDEAELPDIGEERYLYCVVRVGGDPDVEASGVDEVREWFRDESLTLDRALTELSGHREYRVEVAETGGHRTHSRQN
jgi:hypothetical protein